MKNHYEIKGELTVIFLRKKNGDIIETAISTSDLSMVQLLNVSFYPVWNKDTSSYYVNYHTVNSLGKKTNKSLHRLLMGDPKSKIVDHINHDTLDNRRSNLRIVNNSQSMQNTRLSNANKSGYKNVSWHKTMNRWRVRLNKEGEELMLGYFDCVHEAGRIAKDARKKHYTHSPENREDKHIENKIHKINS